MGLMDKAKEAALQAKASAQQVAQQGQAKVATIQQSRSEAELYRTLGEAYFNEQRRGGSHEAVTVALNALEQHFAAGGGASTGGAPGADPSTPPPAGSSGGDYTFDNL